MSRASEHSRKDPSWNGSRFPRLSRRGLQEIGAFGLGYAEVVLERLFEGRPAYETVEWEAALRDLDQNFGGVESVLGEASLREAEDNARRLLARGRPEDPYVPRWALDSVMARCCYLVCRLLKPSVVVETGVAYGVSSAFILKALEQNGHGTLHSIDLPPPRRDYARSWAVAVPDAYRDGWTLHRGSSRRVLPGLLQEIGPLDLFVHDSLHTRRNMAREFETVWPRLRTGGVLLADDVERNSAFADLLQKNPSLWRVVRDRERVPLHGKAAPVVFGIVAK